MLYFSANIIKIVKPKRIRWAGHVTQMGRRGIFVWKSEKKDYWEYLDVDESIILKWI
jgi:hypothetical protein